MTNSSSREETERREDSVVREPPARGRAFFAVKRLVQLFFAIWVSPRVWWYRLWRCLIGERAFGDASESIAKIPGWWGVYCRQAFYRATLTECGRDVHFGWGSAFSMVEAKVGEGVYIGRRCGIGFGELGARVMLADGVQVLSGGQEHGRGGGDRATHQDQPQHYRRVVVGPGAWIGTNAVIMASVGANSIIGAGAVVTKPIGSDCVAVGVPAREVKKLGGPKPAGR